MTPKELVDKITLAAEQLESLRTEHDLPLTVYLGEEQIVLSTANKAVTIEVCLCDSHLYYNRGVVGKGWAGFNTYEELVEDIKNR